jgi:hypothetical protein
MSLLDDIRAAQIRAGEDAVIKSLERSGLKVSADQIDDKGVDVSTDYKTMFEQAVRSLAAIDDALGIGDDGCGELDQTLYAIAELKRIASESPASPCPTCEALALTVMMDQTGAA